MEYKKLLHQLCSEKKFHEALNLIDSGNVQVDDLDPDRGGSTALMWTCFSYPCVNTAKELIKRGANVEARDICGMNPLLWACQKGYVNIAKLLISEGADINAIDKSMKWNVFMAACYGGNIELIKFLLIRGANTGGKDIVGRYWYDFLYQDKEDILNFYLSLTKKSSCRK